MKFGDSKNVNRHSPECTQIFATRRFGQNNSNRPSRDDVHAVNAKKFPNANDNRSGSKSKSQKGVEEKKSLGSPVAVVGPVIGRLIAHF